jgi:ABC-type amino acid transport substrate-binding protein
LETGQPQQYSVAKGETVDFSDAMAQVEAAYLDALDSHFNDHLIPSLATGKGDVILAGGAAI